MDFCPQAKMASGISHQNGSLVTHHEALAVGLITHPTLPTYCKVLEINFL